MTKLRLLTRRSLPVPTLWAWLLFVSTMLGAAVFFVVTIEPYLSPTSPVESTVLVAEGWLPDYAMDSVASRFTRSNYRRIITTGGVLEQGSYLKEFRTHAEVGAATLRALGIPDSLVIAVPAEKCFKDRTWVSALAFAAWAQKNNISSINLCSLGAHARRSRYLFQKALGDSVAVGIISIPDAGYNARTWWTSSHGFKLVTGEAISYVYLRCIFKP